MRVDSRLNIQTPPGTTHSGGASHAHDVQAPVHQQVQTTLFGYRPQPFDMSQLAAEQQQLLGQLLRMLSDHRLKLDVWANEPVGRPIVLAQNTIAAIDAQGTIYFDASFLLQHAQQLDLLVGVLAHEVGHRPGFWAKDNRRVGASRKELEEICRYEEILADTFAGRALGNLGLSVEPMIALIKQVSVEPHPLYMSAEARGEVLRQAQRDGARRLADERKFFPQMHRATSLRETLGVF